jgi:RimJ/RimL family protein N-acetyltransferase
VKAIETARLVIRNFTVDDWPDLQEISAKYKALEYAQYDQEWPTSADEIKSMVEWFAGGDRFLAVCLKATGKEIGLIALNPKPDQGDCVYGLGYVFNSDYYRQGYATESCRPVIDYAFSTLKATRITVGTALVNEPSCYLLRKLGFKETGRGTGSFRKAPDGTPIEFASVSFALSRKEWRALDPSRP